MAQPETPPQITNLRINVPAGTQRQLTLAATDQSEILDLYWVADPGSAQVAVSHTVATAGLTGPSQDASGDKGKDAASSGAGRGDASEGKRQPLATGMQWWPTVSAVPAVDVSAQIGALVPQVR